MPKNCDIKFPEEKLIFQGNNRRGLKGIKGQKRVREQKIIRKQKRVRKRKKTEIKED